MIEHTHWLPVAAASQVGNAPLAVTLLGQAVVLWRDATGQAHAWPDRCPHRGARLSLGRCLGDRLECPYHGWQFDAAGRCVELPATPLTVIPASHHLVPHALQEAHGLVWVCLGEASRPLPAFEAETDGRLRKVLCGPYDVATSAPRIVENFLDMAHFGYVHDQWLGSRARPEVTIGEVQATDTGLQLRGARAWQPQSSLHATAPAQIEYAYEVTGPYSALLTKVPPKDAVALADYRESIALFICPVTPESSRVWFRQAMADFDTPESRFQAFQHTIFLQDQPVLESQVPKCLPLDPRAEAHSAADRASLAYRRFLQGSGITFGVC